MAYINGQEVLFTPFWGWGGIIECETLPTENINKQSLYRTADGLFWYDTEWRKVIEEDNIVVPDKSQSQRGKAGLINLYNDSSGLTLDPQNENRLRIAAANTSDIDAATSQNKPIVPATFKFAMQNKAFKGDLSTIVGTHADASTPASSFAINKFVMKYALHFKMDVIEKGGTFTIKPGMLALVMPYGDYTLSVYNGGTTVASSMGTTMIFAAERDSENWDNNYWMALVYAKKGTLGVASVSSNHNQYSSNCTIKNNYSGDEGSGRAYVYYLSKD